MQLNCVFALNVPPFCVETAQCIGHGNVRFFISMLLFGALGCGLATALNMPFVFRSSYLPNDWSIGFRVLCLFTPPGLLWILRLESLLQTLFFTLTTSTMLMSLMLSLFVGYYLQLCLHNRTMGDKTAPRPPVVPICVPDMDGDEEAGGKMESSTLRSTSFIDVSVYDLDWRTNLDQFLGKHWFKALFVPFYQSQPTVDGISFPLSDQPKFR